MRSDADDCQACMRTTQAENLIIHQRLQRDCCADANQVALDQHCIEAERGDIHYCFDLA